MTPITIMGFNPGTYSYRLTLPGYYDATGSFDIVIDDLTRTISETLQPIVVQAGFGGTGMILMAGLAIGALYMMSKRKK